MSSPNPDAAQAFHKLHREGLLVLPNAWDAGTARLFESLGARAIATTSAAVAWSHGYADGDFLPVPLLVATVTDIVRVIRVPLSVDMEGGYSGDAAAVGEAVAAVIGAGGVGINLEDGAGSPGLLCAKIEAAKRAGVRLGVDLFVNARTDVYLRGLAASERRVEETLARAERYRAAGADGIFVPGLVDPAETRAIAAGVGLPLNILARPGLAAGSELAAWGVRRLSAGSGVAQAVYGKAAALATAFLRDGASDPLTEGALPYAEINALIGSRPE
jgi:2-methylisocitrate lyase-like PEP mutase family enzyme